PADLQHGRQVPLSGQPLAGDELAERDGRDEAFGDTLPRGPQRDRGQQRAERLIGGRHRAASCPSGSPGRPPAAKKPAMNLARVCAPRTMLASSTASSLAWMLRAAGP